MMHICSPGRNSIQAVKSLAQIGDTYVCTYNVVSEKTHGLDKMRFLAGCTGRLLVEHRHSAFTTYCWGPYEKESKYEFAF
jgi:hypothetical protein